MTGKESPILKYNYYPNIFIKRMGFKIKKENLFDDILNLKMLCIKNVVKNLKLNYAIVKKEKWRIPTQISDLIFYFIYKGEYDSSNLIFFEKNICSLSEFIIDKNTTKNNHFLKIDVTHLKEIKINMNNKDNFNISKSELKEYYSGMKNIEKLKLISLLEGSEIFSYISHFSETLKVLISTNCHYLHIKPFLQNCKQLEEFKIQKLHIYDITLEEIFQFRKLKNLHFLLCDIVLSEENLPKNVCFIWENLKRIELEEVKMSSSSWDCFQRALEGSPNINHVYLKSMTVCEQIFKGLLPSSKNLNTFFINYCKFDNSTIQALKLLLSESIHLETFIFCMINLSRDPLKEIIDGLAKSCNSLKRISFQESLHQDQCEDMKNFLLNCTHLEKANFCDNVYIYDGIFKICEGLETSFQCLKHVDFGGCIKEEQHFEYLKEMELKKENIKFSYSYYIDVNDFPDDSS